MQLNTGNEAEAEAAAAVAGRSFLLRESQRRKYNPRYLRTAMAACAQTEIICFLVLRRSSSASQGVLQESVREAMDTGPIDCIPSLLMAALAAGMLVPALVTKTAPLARGRVRYRVVIKRGSSASASRGAFVFAVLFLGLAARATCRL